MEVPTGPSPEGAATGRSPHDDIASLARGGALNIVGVVANALLGFALVIVVTRGFGPTATGLFFESAALFHIVATAAQWGAEVGVVRMVPRYGVLGREGDLRTLLASALVPALVAGVALALVLEAFAAPLARVLTNGEHGADLAPMVRVLAPFVPVFAAFTVAAAATRGFGTMVPTTLVDKIGRAAAQPALALVVVAAGASTVALGVAWATPYLLGLVAISWWLAVLVRRTEGAAERPRTTRPGAAERPRTTGPGAVAREFWRFTAPRGLASLFSVSILWLSTLILGALRSSAEAGVYASAIRYVTLGQFVGVAIAQVAAPKLSEVLSSGDRERGRIVYATATSWLVALAWPLYLTMIVLGPALLSVFGSGYGDAAPVLAILGAAMLVATVVGPVDIVLLMAGKSSWNLANTVVAVVLNVSLNLALVPAFGIRGAAVAWAASILANNLLPLVQVWRAEGLHPFGPGTLASAGPALMVFGLGGVLVRVALGPGVGSLLVLGLAGGLLYLGLLWRFRDPLHLGSFRDLAAPLRRRAARS